MIPTTEGQVACRASSERGLWVTGLAMSRDRLAFALARRRPQGVRDQATPTLQGCRDEREESDGVASTAMVEPVGERHGLVRLDALRTGWNAALNIISVGNRRWGLGRREEVARQGFDSRSRRMRGIHLASCAAAFRGGNCDPTQITLSRPA